MQGDFTGKDWALTEEYKKTDAKIDIYEEDFWVGDGSIAKQPIASITNGKIKAVVNFAGVITFYKDDKQILREYYRSYGGTLSKESRQRFQDLMLSHDLRNGRRRVMGLIENL